MHDHQHAIGARCIGSHDTVRRATGRCVIDQQRIRPQAIGPQVIGVGTLLRSAALGMVAIAASSHTRGVVLADARVCRVADDGHTLCGTLRNADDARTASMHVALLLLDRHGRCVARSQARIGRLAVDATCLVRSAPLPAAATHFRFQQA